MDTDEPAAPVIAAPTRVEPGNDEGDEQERDVWASSRPEDLVIKLVTFGPGDQIFNYFGHNAMVVEDKAQHTARLYNFGMFHFGADMLPKYLKGKLTFWVGESSVRATFAHYRRADRAIRIQELNLSPEHRQATALALAKAVLPENRDYLYDHFFDNCSTRLRDLVDDATDGQFKRALDHSARMSFRQHIRRYAQRDPVTDFALVFWMNHSMERPIKQWDELFLPEELEHQVARLRYRNELGQAQPLVALSYSVYEPNRPAAPPWPNRGYPAAIAIGLAIGLSAYLLALWAAASGGVWPRRLLGLHHTLFGLVFGVPGLLAALMWGFTEHLVTYNNENLFLSNPLTFALFPLGIAMMFGRAWAWRWTRTICYALAASSLLLLLLKLLPSFYQDTTLPMSLFLPANVLLALGHFKLARAAAADVSPVRTRSQAVSRA
ncbi:MAG: hypothetical protein RL701_1154 [Pseudomonadota bacterium]